MKHDRYILNPDYIFKNDVKRVLLYSTNNRSQQSSKLWFSIIHPVQAMLLSFFSKSGNFTDIIQRISRFLDMDIDKVSQMIKPFIENETPLKVNFQGINFVFPKNVIIREKNPIQRQSFSPEDMVCSNFDFISKRLYSNPMHITLMLTNKCVTQCKYCYADTQTIPEKQLSTEEIFHLIDEAHQTGLQNFNLIGGEVFLHKDWPLILEKIVKCGFMPDILSTKVPFTEKMIDLIKNTGYTNNIQVSLDALSPQILKDSLCVNTHYTERMKNGIRLLDESGLTYQIATILTQYNDQPEIILELFSFIKTLKNIKRWRIAPATNSLYKNYSDFVKIKTNRIRVENLYSFIEKEIIPSTDIPILLDRSYINRGFYESVEGSASFKGAGCSALNDHLFILPDGKVTICEQLYWNPQFIIGNVRENSLSEIWNSRKALELAHVKKEHLQVESKCRSCRQFQDCYERRNRCWTDVIKAYGDKNWDYPDPRCKKAPKMIYNIAF